MSRRCVDCGVNTLKINEYYMVENRLWDVYGPARGMLCIGCLEKRIGRKLVPSDFSRARINWSGLGKHSPRLADRIGHNPPPANDELIRRLRRMENNTARKS